MTLPEAQRVTGHDGYDDDLGRRRGRHVAGAAQGGDLSASWARDFTVRTGKEQAEKQAQDLSDALGFIRTALLVFAGVALLVGGFLIFNTFSVTVAQRTREFALLRTLGASRRQVLRSVLAETLVIGLVASVLGILVRPRCSRPRWRALLKAFGLDLGTTGTVLEPRTVDRRPARRRDRHGRLRLRAGAPRTRVEPVDGDARQRHARRRAPAQAPHRDRRSRRRGASASRSLLFGAVRRHRDGSGDGVAARASARC